MKFVYAYRSRDNSVHEGVVAAASRDDAYRRLKAQGIRPSSVVPAPGFLNRLAGFGKRGWAVVILSLALLGAGVVVVSVRAADPYVSQDRHQIYGDEAIVDACVKSGWVDVFDDPGDALLARFAQPGTAPGIQVLTPELEKAVLDCLNRPLADNPNDLTEYRQVRAIVAGIKRELRQYLRDGGTVPLYFSRLVDRQKLEASIYRRYAAELKNETDIRIWARRNGELRDVGIRTIPMPVQLLRSVDDRVSR